MSKTDEERLKRAKDAIETFKQMKPFLSKIFGKENFNSNSLLTNKLEQILEEEKVPQTKIKKVMARVEKEIMGIVR